MYNMTLNFPNILPVDGEASWSLLPSLVSLLSGSTVQPESTYSCIFRVKGQAWESQKKISISLLHTEFTEVLKKACIRHVVDMCIKYVDRSSQGRMKNLGRSLPEGAGDRTRLLTELIFNIVSLNLFNT